MEVLGLLALGLAIGLVLGGLGGGGAILTVPLLVFVVGQSAVQATTSSLVIVGLAAATGAISHIRSGGIDWRIGLSFGVAGIPAAWLGSHLSHIVSERALLIGFSALMLLAATGMFRDSRKNPPAHHDAAPAAPGAAPSPSVESDRAAVSVLDRTSTEQRTRTSPFLVVAVGLGVGFITGFFGVGGGFVIVPALVLVLGIDMQLAVGTSLVIVALNSASSLVARSATASFEWHVIIPFALAAMIATVFGRKIADRLPARQLRRGFASLLVLVAIYTIVRS